MMVVIQFLYGIEFMLFLLDFEDEKENHQNPIICGLMHTFAANSVWIQFEVYRCLCSANANQQEKQQAMPPPLTMQ